MYQEARKLLKEGRNIFITGAAGTGKSHLLNLLKKTYGGELVLTASTGIAALNIGGMTLHSYAGLGRAVGAIEHIKAQQGAGAIRRIQNTRLLAIDEISMVSDELLHVTDRIMRMTRQVDKPFGGVQVIFVGDFFQLPPVPSDDEMGNRTQVRYAFMHPIWEEAQIYPLILTTCYRQKDDLAFYKELNKIRVGEPFDREIFARGAEYDAQAVHLFARNDQTDEFNHWQLIGLPPQGQGKFTADDIAEQPWQTKVVARSSRAPKILHIRNGARVMLLVNKDVENGLVNGSLGEVINIDQQKERVWVRFDYEGVEIELKKEEVASMTIGGAKVALRKQIPLVLAWAMSIHKCVHPDTLVDTQEGLLPIKDISDHGVIYTVGGSAKYNNKQKYPRTQCIKITTKHGYTLTATKDHGIAVGAEGRRKNAENICVGDLVRIVRGTQNAKMGKNKLPTIPAGMDCRTVLWKVPKHMNKKLAEFIGLVVADGTLYRGGIRLAKRHKDVVERFAALGQALFGYKARVVGMHNWYYAEINSCLIRAWLTKLGGMLPNRKNIPACILRASLAQQAKFMRGLAEDGTVQRKHGAFSMIELSTSYEAMSVQWQILLLRQGVVSTRKCTVKHNTDKKHKLWRLWIYGLDAAMYAKKIGFVSAIKNKALAGAGGRHKRLHKDLGKTILDPITSIKKVTAETYCVTVPQYGRFVQNGLDGFNSQGMTLPKVMVDISASFAPGMVYVALSRTPTSDGLHVKGLSDSIFLADPQVIEFYKKMEAGYGK